MLGLLWNRFRNEGKEAIEAIYTFPMDPQGVLQSFEVDMDGRKLFSEVSRGKMNVIVDLCI